MKYTDIKRYLKPYGIVARRKTTINHAFAAAIAPNDVFDDVRVCEAIRLLGQSPEEPLKCVYCFELAQTWDHVFATVAQGNFSGYGHRIGNLLPCCKFCNSSKGAKNWIDFLNSQNNISNNEKQERIAIIQTFLAQYSVRDIFIECNQYKELQAIKIQILKLMSDADELASKLRASRT